MQDGCWDPVKIVSKYPIVFHTIPSCGQKKYLLKDFIIFQSTDFIKVMGISKFVHHESTNNDNPKQKF